MVETQVKFVVVGHHSRIGHAQRLAALLDAHLLIDDGSRGANWNHRRAIEWAAELYLVAMDDNGVVQVADLIFKGKVSGTGATAGETNALQYTVSNIFEDWQRPFPDRYTDESHQSIQPGDRLFRYVAQMAERSIYWGSKKDAPGFTYS